jgi:hypothetical protein
VVSSQNDGPTAPVARYRVVTVVGQRDEAPVVRRADPLRPRHVDLVVRDRRHDLLQRDPRLQPAEVRAEAVVAPDAEGQ